MERVKHYSIYDIPDLLARMYWDKAEFAFDVEVVGYKWNGNTLILYTNAFYADLYGWNEALKRHYGLDKKGRVKIFVNWASPDMKEIAEITENLPDFLREGHKKRGTAVELLMNIELRRNRDTEDKRAFAPFTLSINAEGSQIQIIKITNDNDTENNGMTTLDNFIGDTNQERQEKQFTTKPDDFFAPYRH